MKAIYWRLGFPGWRLASNLGFTIKIKVDVCRDPEAGVYVATGDDIGLAVEAESLDALIDEIHAALPELLALANLPAIRPRTDIRFHENLATA